MSFTMEIYELLQRYTKDSEGKDITLAELQHIAWWRCVWGWWMAQAYYQINGFYERIEDVPEGLEDFTIMGDVKTSYRNYNGKNLIQTMTKEDCKSIYG